MRRGKDICKQLKAVRKRIAEENGISLELPWRGGDGERACIGDECNYDGPCRGTCPRCEAEVRYLEQRLTDHLRRGRVATVAGLSLGLAACGGQSTEHSSPLLTTDDSLRPVEIPASDSIDYPESTLAGLMPLDENPIEESPEEPPQLPSVIITDDDDDELTEGGIFVIVEEEASFPGGEDSLQAFIQKNLTYPEEARLSNITGTVYATFMVKKDGSIANPRILQDIGGGCGDEVLRLLESMPRWKPARQRAKIVEAWYTLPFHFSLDKGKRETN